MKFCNLSSVTYPHIRLSLSSPTLSSPAMSSPPLSSPSISSPSSSSPSMSIPAKSSVNVQSCNFSVPRLNVPSSLLHARTAEALHVLKDASRCRTVAAVPSLASFGELLPAGTWQDVHCRRRSTQQSCMLRRFFDIKVAKVHASSFPRLPTVAYRHTGGVRGVRTRCQENTFLVRDFSVLICRPTRKT